jgi:hypothetical protein
VHRRIKKHVSIRNAKVLHLVSIKKLIDVKKFKDNQFGAQLEGRLLAEGHVIHNNGNITRQ